MKTALICGISGQDGAYLADFLLDKDYRVYGTSRDAEASSFVNLSRLGIKDKVTLTSMSLTDFRSVLQTISKINPDEIYNLAGQSSVSLSFQQPVETMESITIGCLNLLEVIRFLNKEIRLYNAGSSECFGDTGDLMATEKTSFHPRSPYAVAKSAAHWEISNYREAYNIFACTGILFNHESPLRPKRFVTRKIVSSACEISNGKREKLCLGNIDIQRDWGWAPEYVDAMWRILQIEKPEDYVIATGCTNSLKDFCKLVFGYLNLDWNEWIVYNEKFYRPSDIVVSRGNPEKAKKDLNWEATVHFDELISKMVDSELEHMNNQ